MSISICEVPGVMRRPLHEARGHHGFKAAHSAIHDALALQVGTGRPPKYLSSESALPCKKRVVLVSIQYRLGVWGFLKVHGGDANVGLWDQVRDTQERRLVETGSVRVICRLGIGSPCAITWFRHEGVFITAPVSPGVWGFLKVHDSVANVGIAAPVLALLILLRHHTKES
jgi:hypothetical protein